jgi:DNA polymerase/3'-5' exonuclease PolX
MQKFELKIPLETARQTAAYVLDLLKPHCHRAEIAGSIRREKPEVKDIEIVCIPKPYEIGLFATGIATVVENWQKVKGELPCKYTQRILPNGIKLDLFFADEINWGLIFAIRTGSAEYSHKVLATRWTRCGMHSINGYLTKNGKTIAIPEEKDLFQIIGLPFTEPQNRNL